MTEFDFMQIFKEEKIGFLSTVNSETGAINQNVVSWITGYTPHQLRIAISAKSSIVDNVIHNPIVTFTFFHDKKIVSLQTKAKLVTQSMQDVPMDLALISLSTDELTDIMFYGAEIVQEPIYRKTYNQKAAKKLDERVYRSMALTYNKSI